MLNLFVRLMKLRLLLPFVLLLVAAQVTPPLAITAPLAGDVLRGEITITGTMDIENFISAQLDFGYASNQAGNWFTLQTFSQPVLPAGSALAVWNTAAISDGDYVLRLRVNLNDGSFKEVTVPVKVQNDIPFPTPTVVVTSTPDAVTVQIPTPFLLAASPTPTEVPPPTPIAFPTNPVSLNQNAIFSSLGRGALVIIGLFVFSGIILRLRRA